MTLKNATSTATLDLKNCTLSGTTYAVSNSGEMAIDGGSYGIVYDDTTNTEEFKNTTLLSVTMNKASNITLNNCGLKDVNNTKAGGVLTINNSSIKTLVNAGTATLNTISYVDSNYISTSSATSIITNTGNMEIDDLTIDLPNELNYPTTLTAIKNNNANASIDCNDCNILMKNKKTIYGIDNTNGTLTMVNGSIDVSGATAYGIYIPNGSVTIGEAEPSDSPNYGTAQANVSTTIPSIRAVGTSSGIGVKRTNGAFNFFDGRIVGSTSAKPDATTLTEHYFSAENEYTETDTGYKMCYPVYTGV